MFVCMTRFELGIGCSFRLSKVVVLTKVSLSRNQFGSSLIDSIRNSLNFAQKGWFLHDTELGRDHHVIPSGITSTRTSVSRSSSLSEKR